jgi:hypothetical protein
VEGELGTTFGAGVLVPSRVWKIVVFKDAGAALRVWAVDVPNAPPPRHTTMDDFSVSLATMESKTGFDLLPRLPPDQRHILVQVAHAITCESRGYVVATGNLRSEVGEATLRRSETRHVQLAGSADHDQAHAAESASQET